MYQCVFYTNHYKQDLSNKVNELLADDEMMPLFEWIEQDDMYSLKFMAQDKNPHNIEIIAHIISDVVQKIGITQTTKRYLSHKKDLIQSDKNFVEQHFINTNYLSEREGFSALSYYFVYMPLLEALKQHQTINIDGWITFRIYKYKTILEELLEGFIEDYLLKKEIFQLIEVFRQMNDLEESLQEKIHLVYADCGKICLLNEEMQDLTADYIKDYCKELLIEGTFNEEDLIMHIILILRPKILMIHQKKKAKQPQFIDALESIFGICINYCNGCIYCNG